MQLPRLASSLQQQWYYPPSPSIWGLRIGGAGRGRGCWALAIAIVHMPDCVLLSLELEQGPSTYRVAREIRVLSVFGVRCQVWCLGD